MEFQIVSLSPDEKYRDTYTFAPGVVGFYATQKTCERWEQLKGWVVMGLYHNQSAINVPPIIARQALAKYKEIRPVEEY